MRNKVLLIDITFDPSYFSLDSPFKKNFKYVCLKFNFETAMNVGIRPLHVSPMYSRPKSTRTCMTQSGSWQIPPPTPSYVMPRIDTHNCPRHVQCSSKNPNIEYLFFSGQMVTCVHDPVDGGGGATSYPQPPIAVKTLQATTAHV